MPAAKTPAGGNALFVQGLIDSIPTPVYYKNPDGRFAGCNRSFERISGVSRERLVGRCSHDFWPRELADIYVAADAKLLESPGNQEYETEFQSVDGATYDVVFHKATLQDNDGTIVGLVGVMIDVTARKRAERQLLAARDELAKLATTDATSGLPNHRAMISALDTEIARADRYGRPLTLLFIDLDHFKAINDTFGHATGDDLLREFGQIISSELRAADMIGRWGGEEFLVLLRDSSGPGALDAAERLRIRVYEHVFTSSGVRITCSIGLAVHPEHGTTRDELVEAADQAMYQAKHRGRNTTVVAAAETVPAQTETSTPSATQQ